MEKIAKLVNGIASENVTLLKTPETPPDTPPETPPETSPETLATQQPILEKFKFTFVTAGSVAKIIKGLKNTTSLGIDKIPTAAWKLGVEILAGPVAKLINLSLSTGRVPRLFKSALVHPVYKGGGKDP